MIEDEDLLMAVLNSAPVVRGEVGEQLDGPDGVRLACRFGGAGSAPELSRLREVRRALHLLVHGRREGAEVLAELLGSVTMRPDVSPVGIDWTLEADPHTQLAARTALAWSRVIEAMPGRLRPCANSDCNLYLLDHSRPGTARWCSMAACGNRSKARAHARRTRTSTTQDAARDGARPG